MANVSKLRDFAVVISLTNGLALNATNGLKSEMRNSYSEEFRSL